MRCPQYDDLHDAAAGPDPVLAELDDLLARAAGLRARLGRLAPAGAAARPGWPIRRLPASPVQPC